MDLTQRKKAWIFREYYGLPQAPESADCVQYGKALLCCANADGTLAPDERRWVMGFSYTNGVPWEEVATWAAYDAQESIASLVAKRPLLIFGSRSVIYDAIRACAADRQYSVDEQQMIRRIAEGFGLSEDDVVAIENAWTAEQEAKRMRIGAIFPGANPRGIVPPAAEATLREAWVLYEYYGIDTPPNATAFEVYAQLLLSLAGADGQVSTAEREWVLGLAATCGVLQDGIDRLSVYPGTDDLEGLVEKSRVVSEARRAVVYDAIRACDSDADYSPGERTAVHRAAKRLGIDAETIEKIESAWAAEKAAKLARQAAVFPQISDIAAMMTD